MKIINHIHYTSQANIYQASNEFISKIYHNKFIGWAALNSNGRSKPLFRKPEELKSGKAVKDLLLSGRNATENMGISLCSYSKPVKANTDSIINVMGYAVEVDIRAMMEKHSSYTLSYLMGRICAAEENGMPVASYKIMGKTLRLLYLFDGPFIVPAAKDKESTEKRESALRVLNALAAYTEKKLVRCCGELDMVSRPLPLTTFIRLPYSIECEFTGRHWDSWKAEFVYEQVEKFGISIFPFAGYHNFKQLTEIIFPYGTCPEEDDILKITEVRKYKVRPGFFKQRIAKLTDLVDKDLTREMLANACAIHYATNRQAGKSHETAYIEAWEYSRLSKTTGLSIEEFDEAVSRMEWNDGWKEHITNKRLSQGIFRDVPGIEKIFPERTRDKSDYCRDYYTRKYGKKHSGAKTHQEHMVWMGRVVAEYKDDNGWSFSSIAKVLGYTVITVKKYYREYKELLTYCYIREESGPEIKTNKNSLVKGLYKDGGIIVGSVEFSLKKGVDDADIRRRVESLNKFEEIKRGIIEEKKAREEAEKKHEALQEMRSQDRENKREREQKEWEEFWERKRAEKKKKKKESPNITGQIRSGCW